MTESSSTGVGRVRQEKERAKGYDNGHISTVDK